MRETRSRAKRQHKLFAIMVFFGFLVLPVCVSAQSYYLKPEVRDPGRALLFSDFVVDMQQSGGFLLERPFPLDLEHTTLIPAATIRSLMDIHGTENFVLVGEKSLFIPESGHEVPEDIVDYSTSGFLSGTELPQQGWLEFRNSGGGVASQWKIILFLPVVAAARDIRSGEVLSPGTVLREYRKMDTDNGPAGEISGPLDGYRASQFIRKGTVITGRMIEREYLMHSGERIVMTVDKGSISLRLEAIAVESGSRGDRIRIRPVNASKNLYGVIVSDREVRVEGL